MGSCKYYMEVTLGWMLNNKIIVLLSLLSFCLFVSTLALAGQKNKLYWELYDCKNATSSPAPPTEPTPTPAPSPTPAPESTTAPETTKTPGKRKRSLDNIILNEEELQDSSSKLFKILAGTA